jgi:purine-nucleoside phosphorylase
MASPLCAQVSAEQLAEAVAFVARRLNGFVPQVALILGSGLGDLADRVTEQRCVIPYSEIPHFRQSKVHGHGNCLVAGKLHGANVIVQQGRFHFYEGIPMRDCVFPLRVLKLLGAHTLVVTNAAGGVNTAFAPGELMLITDHVNFMGENPLTGDNIDSLGPRFCDMSFAYSKELLAAARTTAAALNLTMREGVYFAMKGPSYETPAEIRMIRALGGDAVGMSTVPEVIVASHMGMRVLGISCITNMAAGVLNQALDHQEVIETSLKSKSAFQSFVIAVLPHLKEQPAAAAAAAAATTKH